MQITLTSRKSQLARVQTKMAQEKLEMMDNISDVTTRFFETDGDDSQQSGEQFKGEPGQFTKKLEDALLKNHADIAVHSLKDLPAKIFPGFILACVLPRAASEDVLVFKNASVHERYLQGDKSLIVGSASPRRTAQLKFIKGISSRLIRGNVDTRLKKLESGDYDAVVLAKCGMDRLGIVSKHAEVLAKHIFIPAGCQGIIGLECLEEKITGSSLGLILEKLNDKSTFQLAEVERSVLSHLGAKCQSAVGVHAEWFDKSVQVKAAVYKRDGSKMILVEKKLSTEEIRTGSEHIAVQLKEQGALDWL